MTFDEIEEMVSSIVVNWNDDTTEQFSRFIPDLPAGEMVDFGTGQAKSAVIIAKLNPKLKITTFTNGDELGSATTLEQYKKMIQDRLEEFGVADRVAFDIGDSRVYPWNKELVAVNIDSGHGYELTRDEIERWVPFVKKNGLIFLDDYLVERCGVKQAVDEYFFNGGFEDLNPNGMCQVFRKLT